MHAFLRGQHIAVVGAGLVGTLMAVLLAQRGAQVTVIEKRRRETGYRASFSNGRSFNITISSRGEAALREAGLWAVIEPLTIPIIGRCCHMGERATLFPYSSDHSKVLYGVRRGDVNTALINSAADYAGIDLLFETQLAQIDKDSGALWLAPAAGGEPRELGGIDFVIGADGVWSGVRQQIHRGERADYAQRFLDFGYREVFIPAAEDEGDARWQMDRQALHVWPRGEMMMFALPNPDGSFTGNFIYPLNREGDFAVPGKMNAWFAEQFPDVARLVPDVEAALNQYPVSWFPTQRHSKWYHGDKVVLLGDAAHATVPFYGQGMNSSFESALELLAQLEAHEPAQREAAFAAYQRNRKPNTDAIADLSIQNFDELRSNFSALVPQARRRVEVLLHRLFPARYRPLHVLVSHSQTNYRDAIDYCQRRDRALRWVGLDLLVFGFAGAQALWNGIKAVPIPWRRQAPVRVQASGIDDDELDDAIHQN